MKYNVYIFTGIPSYGTSGSVEVQKMSLMECFENVFNAYYERNMRDFLARSFSYDIKEMTVKDIFDAVGNKTVFIGINNTTNNRKTPMTINIFLFFFIYFKIITS